ncbi:MAG: ChaN family lipoprotein [Rhizobiaceae bacterium]
MRVVLLLLMIFTMPQPLLAGQMYELSKWQSKHFTGHSLLHAIYSADGNKVEVDELKLAMYAADHLLLGEIHNNPDHHILQANFITEFVRQKTTKPVVVFEMIPTRLQTVLDEAKNTPLKELALKLEWEKRGWFSWEIYQPIFKAALAEKLQLKAGNLDRKLTRQISRQGISSLSKPQQLRLSLSNELNSQMKTSLLNELKDSHCGMLPASALGPMSLVQRARDGAMADAINRSGASGSILIAGNGHVRKDRGVPRLLEGLKTLVIGLIEVDGNSTKITDYPIHNQQNAALYDFVVFTPKFDTTDQCAAMKKMFKKKNKASE